MVLTILSYSYISHRFYTASKYTESCEDSWGEERSWSASGKLRILCVEDNVMHFDFPIWGGEAADMLSDARKVIFIGQCLYRPPSHNSVTLTATDFPGWMLALPSTQPASREAVMKWGPSVKRPDSKDVRCTWKLGPNDQLELLMSCIALLLPHHSICLLLGGSRH